MNGTEGWPWWAKFISAIGTTSAIAVGLAYWLATSHAAALETHAHEQDHAMEVLSTIMRQVCVNTAETPEERAACFRVVTR